MSRLHSASPPSTSVSSHIIQVRRSTSTAMLNSARGWCGAMLLLSSRPAYRVKQAWSSPLYQPAFRTHFMKTESSRKVRVAIIGVGNCASSLVQGVEFYRNAPEDQDVPGLMHVNLGGYHVRDIEFTAAFDIDRNKVSKDLSEAIYAEPNNTYIFALVPRFGVTVHRCLTHDCLGKYV